MNESDVSEKTEALILRLARLAHDRDMAKMPRPLPFNQLFGGTPVPEQVYNPLAGLIKGPNPQVIAAADFGSFIAHGLVESWMSHDPKDPNADARMARPITREDVDVIRGQFLDTVEMLAVQLWRGENAPGDGWLDNIDDNYLTVGNSDVNDEEETEIRWHVRFDPDVILVEMAVTESDPVCIWLDYAALRDRRNVLKVIREARATVSDGEVRAETVGLAHAGVVAPADGSYEDMEVGGIDNDGCVVTWNAKTNRFENCGETLSEYGVDNLTGREKERFGLNPDESGFRPVSG